MQAVLQVEEWCSRVSPSQSRGNGEQWYVEILNSQKRAEVEKILEGAARERQEGLQGQWQQESPSREILEQVRGNADMGCSTQMMRRVYYAMRDGRWEEF